MTERIEPVMRPFDCNGFSQGTLVRKLDKDGNEIGPYICVVGSYYEGSFCEYVEGYEVDTSWEEPLITGERKTIDSTEKVKVVGLFAINPFDRYWQNTSRRIREDLGLEAS